MTDSFDIIGFKKWLSTKGAIHQEPTNEWEVLRYKGRDGKTYVAYKNKKGAHTLPPMVHGQYRQFLHDMNLAGPEAVEKVRRAHGNQRSTLVQALYDRDVGETGRVMCCYCSQFIQEPTVEHFHAVSTGGKNHPDNCGLSCECCNKAAGNLSVLAKMSLREAIRATVAEIPPWEEFNALDFMKEAA